MSAIGGAIAKRRALRGAEAVAMFPWKRHPNLRVIGIAIPIRAVSTAGNSAKKKRILPRAAPVILTHLVVPVILLCPRCFESCHWFLF